MLLKNMLPDDVFKELNKLQYGNSKSSKKRKKKKKPTKKDVNIKEDMIHKKEELKKEEVAIMKKEKTEDFKYKQGKKHIDSCPYCGGTHLEITSNNYYYCDNCGIKVEKR